MSDGNTLDDFPADSFTIKTFCESCGHQGEIDRDKVPDGVTVQQLPERLRCSKSCHYPYLSGVGSGWTH